MKGVFDVRPGSGYNDRLADRYNFTTRSDYLSFARAIEGDWILYRESKRDGGRRGYIGAARVVSVEETGQGAAHANVEDFFAFNPPIPLKRSDGSYREALLRAVPNSRLVGSSLEGKSIRLISEEDFAEIVSEALGEALSPANLVRYGPSQNADSALAPLPGQDFVRRIEATLINRKVRDANFRRMVCQAYNDTCAVTGLRIINGGGRSEVQAAHVWSVERGGPDVIQNGIALSGTVHWLFDRHLISISPDYKLLVADNRIPSELRGLFRDQTAPVLLPKDASLWPHPAYIERHREAFAGK